MIDALSRSVTATLKEQKLKCEIRDDLSQETVGILKSRLASSGLCFRDMGVRPFVTWIDAFVRGVCRDASRTERIAGPRNVTYSNPESLSLITAPRHPGEDQEDVDERDSSSEFMSAVIEGLPDRDTRETVRALLNELSLEEIGKQMGISPKPRCGPSRSWTLS